MKMQIELNLNPEEMNELDRAVYQAWERIHDNGADGEREESEMAALSKLGDLLSAGWNNAGGSDLLIKFVKARTMAENKVSRHGEPCTCYDIGEEPRDDLEAAGFKIEGNKITTPSGYTAYLAPDEGQDEDNIMFFYSCDADITPADIVKELESLGYTVDVTDGYKFIDFCGVIKMIYTYCEKCDIWEARADVGQYTCKKCGADMESTSYDYNKPSYRW